MARLFRKTKPLLDEHRQPVREHGKIKRVLRSVNWFIRIYDANGRAKDIATGTNKITEAKRQLHDLESKKNKHEDIGAHVNRITFDDAIKAVIDQQKANDCAAWGKEQGRIDNHLIPFFGGRRLTSISALDISTYRAQRKEAEAKNGTINREVGLIVRAFRLAKKAKQITLDLDVDRLSEPKQPRKGFFEDHEFDAVRAHLPEHLRPILTFFKWTGWRLGEVLGLQLRQVDADAGLVTLDAEQSKNEFRRPFCFEPIIELRDMLTEQLASAERIAKEHTKIVTAVFHHPDGSPIKPSHWRKTWEAARDAAGYPQKQNHDWRRTAARNLERAAVPRSVGMAMIGHKTEEMYRRYSIVDEERMREAAEKLQGWATEQKAVASAKGSGQVRQFRKRQ